MKKELQFLLPAIGQNESRKNLMFLQCKVSSGKMTLTAANDFLIKRVVMDTKLEDGKHYLELDDVKTAIKLINPKVFPQFTQEGITIKNVTIKFSTEDVEYPNLDKLFNNTKKPVESIGFSDFVYQNALKHAPENVVKFTFSGEGGVIRVDFKDNPEYTAVIMPVRIQW
jgi:DNA polymerase III sliding clamp (beta) subunit (PCNA family)